MKTLVLGLGNEVLSDDGVGILAARVLKEALDGRADVIESSLAGLALLEYFIGYERAIVIDAVKTGRCPAGTIYELSPDELDSALAPSLHCAGEMLAVAERLKLDFPKEIRIFAVEVADPYTIGGPLSPPVRKAFKELLQRVESLVKRWQQEAVPALATRLYANPEERSWE